MEMEHVKVVGKLAVTKDTATLVSNAKIYWMALTVVLAHMDWSVMVRGQEDADQWDV